MKKHLLLSALASMALCANAEVELNVFDHVTFYDGYLVSNIPEDAPDEGCLRLYTFLNAKQITQDQLDAIGENLRVDVTIYPLCDNYDRICSVNLALIPKGQETYEVKYKDTDPKRIEVGRFITPFMNKNKEPKEVPYVFEVDYLSNVLRDASLRQEYDFWLELMVFGVPYAAQSQIVGCAGCNDVFQGSVNLVTNDEAAPLVESNVFVPITIRTADYRADRGMNNYNEGCTDELGKTVKTFTYEVPEDCVDGRVVLVMSNHGAGTNGEEYNRRQHYVYCDDVLALQFKPGRTSCEPFRKYNTQANGIYGYSAHSDSWWQSFSNWCPGDVIDNRLIELGAVEAGTHTVRIEVPEAEFYGKDGYFPVSLFFQGDTQGTLPSAIQPAICTDDYAVKVRVEGRSILTSSTEPILSLELYTASGQLVAIAQPGIPSATLYLPVLESGIYILAVTTPSTSEAHKLAL